MSDADGPAEDDLRRSSNLVAAGILTSRLSGLVREIITAAFLATGAGADAFKAALRIPNLLQNLLGEGVLSASFVPAYSKLLAEGREEDAGALAGAIAGLLAVVTSGLVVVGVVFAAPLTRLLAPGLAGERFELTVTLVRIITPGVGFLVLSAWCLGVLNSHRRFFLSYVAPVAWNVAIIAAVAATAVLISSDEADLATAMAIGAAVGSVAQFAVQLPQVRRLLRGFRLSTSLKVPGAREVVSRFGQVVAGRGGVQLASYVDLLLASLLAVGGLAALTYAQVVYLLPVALFGMSVAAAELPTLSTMDHLARHSVVDRLDAALGRVAFFIVPSTIALVFAGDLIVATLYQWRAFGPDAAVQVGLVLSVYALGLLASTATRVLQSSLYGTGDARTPAIYAVLRIAVSLPIGIALMLPLDAVRGDASGIVLVGDLSWSLPDAALRQGADSAFRLGAVGLAAGAAVGAWFELALLRQRVKIVFGRVTLWGPHGRAILAGGLAATTLGVVGGRLLAGLVPTRLGGLVAAASIGGVYLLTTRLLHVPEAGELTGRLERLLRRR